VLVTATRYEGIIHDFVMLNALRGSNAADAAIASRSTTSASRYGPGHRSAAV
jgi:acetyl esterase